MPDAREEILEGLRKVQEGIDRVFADHAAKIAALEERVRKLEERDKLEQRGETP